MRLLTILIFVVICSNGVLFPLGRVACDETQGDTEKIEMSSTSSFIEEPEKKDGCKAFYDSDVLALHKMVDDEGVLLRGARIKVAIIDSGMRGRLTDCFNFVNGTNDVSDDNGHGAVVTDIIRRVAPDAEILGYKVLDRHLQGKEAYILAALERAVAQKADVISLSFGDQRIITYEPDNPVTIAIENIVKRGVPVIVAAGNQAKRWGVLSPGSSPFPITVGATNDTGTYVAEYSNQGPVLCTWEIKPDVLGPGTYCYQYKDHRGTSFAAPYIAGIIALMKQKHPSWTPEQIKSALATTAKVLKQDTKNISPVAQGSGVIEACKAITTLTFFTPIHSSFEPLEVEKGEGERVNMLMIENRSNTKQVYSLQWKWDHCYEGLIQAVESPVVVLPFERKSLSLSLATTSAAKEGFYCGNLKIKSSTGKWHIPIVAFISKGGHISHPAIP